MPTTEFIKDSKSATHLYVDGKQTNIYFFSEDYSKRFPYLKDQHFFQRQQAERAKKLIDAGEVKPLEGETWDMFDLCAGYRVDLSNTIVLSEKVSYEREIFGCSTPYEITNELMTDLLKVIRAQKSMLTQYSKRFNGEKLLSRTGVYFYKFGYGVYFIE